MNDPKTEAIVKAAGKMLDLIEEIKKGNLSLNEAGRKAMVEYNRIVTMTGYQDI